jgi:hypothetical protein
VAGCEPGSKPQYGTLELEYSVHNQDDVEVMTCTMVMLARRREQGDANGG